MTTATPPPAWCHRCGRETPTRHRPTLRHPELIANTCRLCGAMRKGKPYVSPSLAILDTPTVRTAAAPAAEGAHHDRTH